MSLIQRLGLIFITISWITLALGIISPLNINLDNRNFRKWDQIDFSLNNPSQFVSDLKLTFNDNFFLKYTLVRVINTFEYLVFNSGDDENFLSGKNGWEFFRGDKNIEQAVGASPLVGPELLVAAKNVNETIKRVERRGIPLKIFVVPSKPTVYSELLPDHLEQWPAPALIPVEQVIEILSMESPIQSILYPKLFLKEKKDLFAFPIYEPKGTHWNDFGAYFGYHYLVKNLHEKPINLDNFKIEFREDYKSLSGFYLPSFSNTGFLHSPVLSKLKSNNSKQKMKSVLIFGDSFSEKLIPFLYEHFIMVHFVPSRVVRLDIIDKVKPDLVVHQIAERYFKDVYSNPSLSSGTEKLAKKIDKYFDEHLIINMHDPDRSNLFHSKIKTNIASQTEIYRKIFDPRLESFDLPTGTGEKNLIFEFFGDSPGAHISFNGNWLDLDYQEQGGSNSAIMLIQHNGVEAKIEFAKNEIFVGGAVATKPLGIKNVEKYKKIDLLINELRGTIILNGIESYHWPLFKTSPRGKSLAGLGNFSTSPLRGPKAQFKKVLVRPLYFACSNLPCAK